MKQLDKRYQFSLTILSGVVFGIILLMPFHAFFTTWIGANAGNLLLFRAWKELLLLPVLLIAISLLVRDVKLRAVFFKEKLIWLILIFTIWLLFCAGLHSHQVAPLALGLTIQLRIFVIFLLARILAFYKPPSQQFLEKLVIAPFVGVIVVGLLQIFVLPFDFLKHFGYQKDSTIPPFFTIDDQLSKIRIASTMRGPNPLGVYLILPLIICVQKIWQKKNWLAYSAATAGGLLVLYKSQSRGAWLGALVAFTVWLLLTLTPKWRKAVLIIGVLAVVVAGFSTYSLRHTRFVEDVVLHDNPTTGSNISSNAGHLGAIKAGLADVKAKPLTGCGPGCAGPASVHGTNQAKISENYFLQTAQEVGVIGLGLLLAIFGLVAVMLFRTRTSPLSDVLLASFVGICLASLFAHAWADDTIAYIWWGLAGLLIGFDRHRNSVTATKKQ